MKLQFNRILNSFLFLLLCCLSISEIANAATCSCAGVPLNGTINLTDFQQNKFQFALSYSYQDLSQLVSGKNKINDETGRDRTTDSYLVQTTYGLNEHWSVSGVLSYINHQRDITTSFDAAEESSGIGDTLIVLGYAPQKIDAFHRHEWALGLGVRIPTGKDDNGSPITYAEDLQPGQGASGYSLWFHYAYAFNQKADWIAFTDFSYLSNERNDRDYSFENEWSLIAGINYSGIADWSFAGAFNYRDADPHTRFGNDIPNTGGTWFDFVPSAQYQVSPKNTIVLSLRIPLERDLNGSLQFTTKHAFTLTWQYLLD